MTKTPIAKKSKENDKISAISRSFKKEDFAELGVLLVYLVQNGAVHVDQIQDTLKRVGARVAMPTLKSTLETLKDRDFLARDQRLQENNQLDYEYKVKKLKYKQELENIDKKDKGRAVYYNYGRFYVKYMLTRPMLGSQPPLGNAYLIESWKRSKHKAVSENGQVLKLDTTPPPLLFERDWWSGSIVLHRGIVRGFLELALRRGLTENNGHFKTGAADYIYTKTVFVEPKFGLTYQILPIQSSNTRNGGAGLGTYEALKPGELIQMIFDFPMSILDNKTDKLVSLLKDVGHITPRAPSPGRGSQTGDMILLRVDYKNSYEEYPKVTRLYFENMKNVVKGLEVARQYDGFPEDWFTDEEDN